MSPALLPVVAKRLAGEADLMQQLLKLLTEWLIKAIFLQMYMMDEQRRREEEHQDRREEREERREEKRRREQREDTYNVLMMTILSRFAGAPVAAPNAAAIAAPIDNAHVAVRNHNSPVAALFPPSPTGNNTIDNEN